MKIIEFLLTWVLLVLCQTYRFRLLLTALVFVLFLIGAVWFFTFGDTVAVSVVTGLIGLSALYVRSRGLGNE